MVQEEKGKYQCLRFQIAGLDFIIIKRVPIINHG